MGKSFSKNFLSVLAFLVGLGFIFEAANKGIDTHGTLTLIALIFSLAGIYFGVSGYFKAQAEQKLIPASLAFVNILLAIYVFISAAKP